MLKTRPRSLIALRVEARDNEPLALIQDGAGNLHGVTASQAEDDALSLPRWLVRQIGFLEGSGHVLDHCCPLCVASVIDALEERVKVWRSPPID